MRAALGAAMLAIAGVSAACAGEAQVFPQYDVEAYCRVQANYSFAATLGDSSFDGVLAKCESAERDAMASARTLWATATPNAAAECLDLAEGRYTRLARCLDGGGMRMPR